MISTIQQPLETLIDCNTEEEYSPRVIMREHHELTSELKNVFASKFGVGSCSNSLR